MARLTPWLLVFSLLAAPAPASAQSSDLGTLCELADGSGDAQRFCALVAQGVLMFQPRIGLAAAGGNPVPGTASTVGFRMRSTPRVSMAARVTGVSGRVPPIHVHGASDERRFLLTGLNLDAAVGILRGASPLPTVGGVGSLDLLASVGVVLSSSGADMSGGSPGTVALGARLGIFRESFRVPGVSVSAMYRRVAGHTIGDSALDRRDAFVSMSNVSVVSLRGVVTKRILMVGATAGIGLDRFEGDAQWGLTDPAFSGAGEPILVTAPNVSQTRTQAFVNASWTTVILNLVGELGWQAGGSRISAEFPQGARVDPGRGGLYGGVAVRLTL